MGRTDGYWYDVMFIVVAELTISVGCLNLQIWRHVSGCNIIPKEKE